MKGRKKKKEKEFHKKYDTWNNQIKIILSSALSVYFWSSLSSFTHYKVSIPLKVYNVCERVVE